MECGYVCVISKLKQSWWKDIAELCDFAFCSILHIPHHQIKRKGTQGLSSFNSCILHIHVYIKIYLEDPK